MKNKLQPTRTSFSRNFQCKKAPRWLSKFFHCGTENRADQLKKTPCISVRLSRFSSNIFLVLLTARNMSHIRLMLVIPLKRRMRTKCSLSQGGRTWQAFGGGKNGHETFRQARIYNFRDKCVVFARNLKFSNLTQ